MQKRGDFEALNLILDSVKVETEKLKGYYEEENFEEFAKSKKLVLNLLNQMSEGMK
jgi:hypothetical protein